MKLKLIFALASLVSLLPASNLRAGSVGAVYTANNSTNGNAVLAFTRAADGSLSPAGTFATGGAGTGGGLGSQGALALSADEAFLFVVNAGSDDISVFAVGDNGLTWLDKANSGGRRPISLTTYGNVLYVLNAGGSAGDVDNITGFLINPNGTLSPIPNSTLPLSATSTGPAQVSFSEDGTVLVATEKNTDRIDTYVAGANGTVTHRVFASAGKTPFGFAFAKRNQLIVSEAVGGAANASVVSSYQVSPDGTLQVITPASPTHQSAACWIAVPKNGRFAYASNTGSDSLSAYRISHDGTLALLNADGRAAVTGAGPIDMAFSRNSQFLYTLDGAGRSIDVFTAQSDGGLTPQGNIALLGTANGLVAR